MEKPRQATEDSWLKPLHDAEAKAALEAQRAAVAAEQARLAQLATQSPIVRQTASVQVSGDCHAWEVAAGITDFADAEFILNHESGCNPNAWNASSGAGGLPQALPFSKMGCALGDGYCQMVWFKNYCESRYGSIAGAAAFWRSHNWY